jgi:hypothetical protein
MAYTEELFIAFLGRYLVSDCHHGEVRIHRE